jgi:hypothetical protein
VYSSESSTEFGSPEDSFQYLILDPNQPLTYVTTSGPSGSNLFVFDVQTKKVIQHVPAKVPAYSWYHVLSPKGNYMAVGCGMAYGPWGISFYRVNR